MNPGSVKKGLKECVSNELSDFLDKVESLYEDLGAEAEWKRSHVYDALLSNLLPTHENSLTSNENLNNFLKTTLNDELEKRRKKNLFQKQIMEASASTKLFDANSCLKQSNLSSKSLFSSNNHIGALFEKYSLINSETSSKGAKEKVYDSLIKSENGSDYASKSSESSNKRHYKLYPTELKREIVDYSRLHGIREASRQYRVSSVKINVWSRSFCREKLTRGRKPIDPEMEQKVCRWLKDEIEKGSYLTQKLIREKAKRISCSQNFKASKGWLQKFFKRRPDLFHAYTHNRKHNQFISEEVLSEVPFQCKKQQVEVFEEDSMLEIVQKFESK